MTVSIYLVLAILILIWSLLGSAATLWSSVALSLRALLPGVSSWIHSASFHLICYSEPAWPSLSYPGHSNHPQGFLQSASLSQISMVAPLHPHPALPHPVALL
ncbi:hypothetical protein C8Q74DRAFT_1280385 [Fomes fomentarius]|nr:hypothetical protein C8Q74DRAFT_1280385 [Fomes fomentarius]